jgi:hypothetical protein
MLTLTTEQLGTSQTTLGNFQDHYNEERNAKHGHHAPSLDTQEKLNGHLTAKRLSITTESFCTQRNVKLQQTSLRNFLSIPHKKFKRKKTPLQRQ